MANIFESNAPQDGLRATASTHRKIELQSPADLTYLIANVSKAAREKIDKHLPPDAAPEGEDAMRKRVEQLVDDYIRDTFNAAKDSITINGMDTRELEEELAKASEGEGIVDLPAGFHTDEYTQYRQFLTMRNTELEPFDTKLAQRIQALSTQIEYQTLELANLRRKAPRETAEKFVKEFEREGGEYEEKLRIEGERMMEEARQVDVKVAEIERRDEMQMSWQRGTEGLGMLKEGMDGTVKKMKRAQKAIEAVEEK